MSRWIVFCRDIEDFKKWSNNDDEHYFVVIQKTSVIYCSNDFTLTDDSVLIINKDSIKDAIDDNCLPDDFESWSKEARLWVHHGGVTGQPTESDWNNFINELPEKLKLIIGEIIERHAFGSTWNKHVYSVAELVSEALGKETKQLEKSGSDLLAMAWIKSSLNHHVQKFIEALFPLYIDLHHLSSSEPDFKPALNAARNNLEAVLDQEDKLTSERLMDSLSILVEKWKDLISEEEKSVLQGVLVLFGSLNKVEENGDGAKRFFEAFEQLSEAYTCFFGLSRDAEVSK